VPRRRYWLRSCSPFGHLVFSGLSDGHRKLDQAYQPGRRAMRKYKLWRTVDCVVGGVYLDPRGKQVQSVLLGLYDHDGKLHYVGRSTLHAMPPLSPTS
jgi:hypothetical protein